jgi:hypothetical protein
MRNESRDFVAVFREPPPLQQTAKRPLNKTRRVASFEQSVLGKRKKIGACGGTQLRQDDRRPVLISGRIQCLQAQGLGKELGVRKIPFRFRLQAPPLLPPPPHCNPLAQLLHRHLRRPSGPATHTSHTFPKAWECSKQALLPLPSGRI